ncbi:MAG: hypothetical protein KDK39_01185 [Leptospiraceae bacterium]|nr:hypothetical protein [Leptospiraceae bacterium]
MARKQRSNGLEPIVLAAHTITHLVRVLREALFWWPTDNLRAIIGLFRDLRHPAGMYSEINMLHIHSWAGLRRLLSYLLEAFLLPFGLKRKLKNINNMAGYLDSPDFLFVPGDPDYQDEAWFFVNGVANDQDLALQSGHYIASLFRRPLTVVANPTGAILPDLLAVTLQKGFHTMSSSGQRLYEQLRRELQNERIQRIIVLAHSQGAVILARVLHALQSEGSLPLQRLECYTFGNPADRMQAGSGFAANQQPWLEHFANQKDLVARLGVIAWRAVARGDIQIDGRIFLDDRYGHFLNEHYLSGIELQSYRSQGSSNSQPRLYAYLNGGRPV